MLKYIKNYLIAGLILILFIFARYEVLSGDTLLAWPITDVVQNNNDYDSNDLLVVAGKSGNFLLYQILGNLPILNNNYAVRDFVLFLIVTASVCFIWYNIYYNISKNHIISILSLAAFLFSDGKLGLNWSIVPMKSFLSFSSVYFFEVFALQQYLRKNYTYSFALLALASYFHPGSAISFFLIFLGHYFIFGFNRIRISTIIANITRPVFVFTAIILPNIYLIIIRSQERFAVSEEYFNIYYNFQYHAFLEDHFSEGYVYTILVLSFIFLFKNKSIFKRIKDSETIFQLILVGILGSLVWLVNLYYIRDLQVIHLYFVRCAFYLIKPLTLFLFISLIYAIANSRENTAFDYLFFSIVFATLFVGSSIQAAILIASFFLYVVRRRLGVLVLCILSLLFITVRIEMVDANIYSLVDSLIILDIDKLKSLLRRETYYSVSLFLYEASVLFLGIYFSMLLARKYEVDKINYDKLYLFRTPLTYFSFTFLAVFILLRTIYHPPLNFSIDDYYGVRQSNPEYADLLDWSREADGSLFIVPPYDREFISFRYFSKKGVYIHSHDINQLSYSPQYYLEAFSRLKKVGLVIPRRRVYQWDKYYSNNIEHYLQSGADFIIYQKDMYLKNGNIPTVFENNKYIVKKL